MINFITLETPLGPMLAASREEKLCLLEFSDRKNLKNQLASLEKYFPGEQQEGETPLLARVKEELILYFRGELKEFDLPLIYRGTPFQEKVWEELRKVPYGTTRSYRDQARALGNEKAVRAVAGANSRNPLAIVIPCHRIIGSGGSLTGYAGGLDRKARLLDLEQGRDLFS